MRLGRKGLGGGGQNVEGSTRQCEATIIASTSFLTGLSSSPCLQPQPRITRLTSCTPLLPPLLLLSFEGASTLAVLPCCTGTTSQDLFPQLYQGVPDLPWPLELVALCMLRVLNRRKHEGKLDAGESAGSQICIL